MRKTGPVNNTEVTFGPSEQLVTSTTEKGVITFANETFCRVAGYSRDQLLGQAHNIVRHPDMPQAVFKAMWDDLKAGKHWLGLVKNRCADGSYYWVDAYITPLRENGRIIGYESVRTAPNREQIQRAETVYQRINAGQTPVPMIKTWWGQHQLSVLAAAMAFVLFSIDLAIAGDLGIGSLGFAIVACVAIALTMSWLVKRSLSHPLKAARSTVYNPVASYIYTGKTDSSAEILLAHHALRSKARASLGRFMESSTVLLNKASIVSHQARDTLQEMNSQAAESNAVASSMGRMDGSVQHMYSNVQETLRAAASALEEVQSGETVVNDANRNITELASIVDTLAEVLKDLSHGSSQISNVTQVISEIADQTNLLALNAAIEAARAGDHGRGFSVVADEVRALAQRTQESTSSIQSTVEALRSSTGLAEQRMDSCRQGSQRSVDNIEQMSQSLATISAAVHQIKAATQEMNATADQQTEISKEVNQMAQSISGVATATGEHAGTTATLSGDLEQLARNQFELIERFKE